MRRGQAGFAGRWLGAVIAPTVLHQTQFERNATLVDKTDALTQVLAIVADGHLVSAIVFDDTDRWLSNESAQIREKSYFPPRTGRVRIAVMSGTTEQLIPTEQDQQHRMSATTRVRIEELIAELHDCAYKNIDSADQLEGYSADLHAIRAQLKGSGMVNDLLGSRREDAAKEDLR